MEHRRIRVGSIAVLFTVVVVCAAIFAVLTLVTAGSDLRTARSYEQRVEALYECENLGEQWLAQVNGYLAGSQVLPENTWEDQGALGTEITWGPMRLTARVDAATGAVLEWNCNALWQPEEDLDLWK